MKQKILRGLKTAAIRLAEHLLLSIAIFAATTLVFCLGRFLNTAELNADVLRLPFAIGAFFFIVLLIPNLIYGNSS
ncbi:MAG: hypothetical protein PHW53_04130 [Patescibacteria group bacterium]|nr:hypothetical protein [Patescibacteria group bacterium]